MKVEIEIDDKLFNKDVDEFVNVVRDMIQLYAKKNHDYSNSFDEDMNRIGLAYGIGRIYGKVNRLVNFLSTTFAVNDEKFTDTLEDLANYSVMLRAWINKETIPVNSKKPICINGNQEDIRPYEVSLDNSEI